MAQKRHHHIAGKLRHLQGWRPSPPDHRDLVLKAGFFQKLLRPPMADLEPNWVKIEDQGSCGSCTANSSTSCLEYDMRLAGKPVVDLSRLFAYFASRVWVEGGPASEDSGAVIRDVMKALSTYGVCLESIWPYDESQLTVSPSPAAVQEALNHKLLLSPYKGKAGYFSLPELNDILQCIADGYPCVGGFRVPASMMSDETAANGVVLPPAPDEEWAGGHAVAFMGYGSALAFGLPQVYSSLGLLIKFANSWSETWGRRGFGFLPASYVTKGLATDFWSVRNLSGATPTA